jgi:hypothetical protein
MRGVARRPLIGAGCRLSFALVNALRLEKNQMKRARGRLLIAAFLAAFMTATAYGQQPKSNSGGSRALPPHLVFVFEEYVTLGPSVHPGETPFGDRNIVPITGGVFSGPKIRGKVMPGGWDWQLVTKTGCHSLDANYMIQADDGAIINVINKGTLCTAPGAETQLFTIPMFEAPLGPHAWLNGGAYVGTLELAKLHGNSAVHIRFYQVQ